MKSDSGLQGELICWGTKHGISLAYCQTLFTKTKTEYLNANYQLVVVLGKLYSNNNRAIVLKSEA